MVSDDQKNALLRQYWSNPRARATNLGRARRQPMAEKIAHATQAAKGADAAALRTSGPLIGAVDFLAIPA